jgi:hypothetical protein
MKKRSGVFFTDLAKNLLIDLLTVCCNSGVICLQPKFIHIFFGII